MAVAPGERGRTGGRAICGVWRLSSSLSATNAIRLPAASLSLSLPVLWRIRNQIVIKAGSVGSETSPGAINIAQTHDDLVNVLIVKTDVPEQTLWADVLGAQTGEAIYRTRQAK